MSEDDKQSGANACEKAKEAEKIAAKRLSERGGREPKR